MFSWFTRFSIIPALLWPVLLVLQEYPFVLDPFQREAILCIDNNESVLVSAHTSAGKTVCAEWVSWVNMTPLWIFVNICCEFICLTNFLLHLAMVI